MTKATTAQRGYHGRHDRLRRQWARIVDAGLAECHAATCLQPSRRIEAGTTWDLGHNDDRTDWTGPEHPRCNRVAGGRNGALVTNALRRRGVHHSRDW